MEKEELIERIKNEKSFIEFYALKSEILKYLEIETKEETILEEDD